MCNVRRGFDRCEARHGHRYTGSTVEDPVIPVVELTFDTIVSTLFGIDLHRPVQAPAALRQAVPLPKTPHVVP
jgi:hypothetical protein